MLLLWERAWVPFLLHREDRGMGSFAWRNTAVNRLEKFLQKLPGVRQGARCRGWVQSLWLWGKLLVRLPWKLLRLFKTFFTRDMEHSWWDSAQISQADPDERSYILHSFSCSKRLFLVSGCSRVLYTKHQVKYCQGMGAWISARERYKPSQKNKRAGIRSQNRSQFRLVPVWTRKSKRLLWVVCAKLWELIW